MKDKPLPQNHKVIIFSAPSGSGKTTIVRHLLAHNNHLAFSISACTRPKREHEVEGKDYYFLSIEDFKSKISTDAFVEWEEVYKGGFYGTLKSEVERFWENKKQVIFDVDVKGGLKLKRYFGTQALAVFVSVPSLAVLEERLKARKTESDESLRMRIAKFEEELKFEKYFDKVIINETLEDTLEKAQKLIDNFLNET